MRVEGAKRQGETLKQQTLIPTDVEGAEEKSSVRCTKHEVSKGKRVDVRWCAVVDGEEERNANGATADGEMKEGVRVVREELDLKEEGTVRVINMSIACVSQ